MQIQLWFELSHIFHCFRVLCHREYHLHNISQDKDADYVLSTFVRVMEDADSFVDTSGSSKTFSVSGLFYTSVIWEVLSVHVNVYELNMKLVGLWPSLISD